MAGWHRAFASLVVLAVALTIGAPLPLAADSSPVPTAQAHAPSETAAGAALQARYGDPRLEGNDRAIERGAFELIAAAGATLEATYLERHGRTVNTDDARELFPAYRADRSRAAAVQRPATLIADRVYARLLAADAGTGAKVLFLAGGAGSGKTTALNRLRRDAPAGEVITFDGTFANETVDLQRIEEALGRGYAVEILYVHLDDPLRALANALNRAEQMAAELGTGRTVPARTLVALHAQARRSFVEIALRYAGDPRVTVTVIDHSGGPDAASPTIAGDAAVAFLRARLLDAAAVARLQDAAVAMVEERYRAGAISAATYRGFMAGG